MKKGKKELFYLAAELLVILLIVVFFCESVNSQIGYSTMSSPWLGKSYYMLGSSGQMASTTISPWIYTSQYPVQSYTKTNPWSTLYMYASTPVNPSGFTQTNPASTTRSGGGATDTINLNQDTYFHSGWVETVEWYYLSQDLYGWKPWDMTGNVTLNLWDTEPSWGTGGGLLPTSLTCIGCGITSATCYQCGQTFTTCFGCNNKKEILKFPGFTSAYCPTSESSMTCGSWVSSCIPGFPGPFPSYENASNFPSQPPTW